MTVNRCYRCNEIVEKHESASNPPCCKRCREIMDQEDREYVRQEEMEREEE